MHHIHNAEWLGYACAERLYDNHMQHNGTKLMILHTMVLSNLSIVLSIMPLCKIMRHVMTINLTLTIMILSITMQNALSIMLLSKMTPGK